MKWMKEWAKAKTCQVNPFNKISQRKNGWNISRIKACKT